jgi:glutamine cyclotransferase
MLPALLAALLAPPGGSARASAPVYGYEVLAIYPHDTEAFTQGLIFENGYLYESTGGWGISSLRKVEAETGVVLLLHDLPGTYFGEGLTALRDTLYQLTWNNHVGLVYVEQDSFELVETFDYPWNGWGLTHDGTHLIASDGSSYLRFIDPDTYEEIRVVRVLDDETPVSFLNELEYIQGRVYSNIWQSDQVAVIDPISGSVEAWLDLGGLCDSVAYHPDVGVLNGIAFGVEDARLFVTGKDWPLLFEIDVPTLHPQGVDVADSDPAGRLPSLLLPASPFARQAEITYVLPRDGEISLQLIDVSGRARRALAEGWRVAGTHAAAIDFGSLPAGVYFVRLTLGDTAVTGRLLRVP